LRTTPWLQTTDLLDEIISDDMIPLEDDLAA
jgi:hypothetical protein